MFSPLIKIKKRRRDGAVAQRESAGLARRRSGVQIPSAPLSIVSDLEIYASEISDKLNHIKKNLGIFFTPQRTVDFMVNLIDEENLNSDSIKILEPACGICQFLYGIRKNKSHVFSRATKKVGVEINREIIDYIHKKNLNKDIEIFHCDYLLWETNDQFDVIIGNPPYGIPSLSEHYTIKVDNETKETYKQIYETWYGKYNVYGAFIEKSIKLLKENGQLIFIIPATFMILDEFKKLRKFLSENGKTEIIYMGSDIFKHEADISTVILKFTKSQPKKNELRLYDYDNGKLKPILKENRWFGEIVLFSTEFSKEVDKICTFRLGDIYNIKISPRTPEIKHNPYVVKSSSTIKKNLLPILNSKNLLVGEIIYKPISGYWIEADKKTKLRSFFAKPHIVVGLGFRGDGQIGAAYDYRAYPWMGDVYHLLRELTLTNRNFNLTDEEVVNFLTSQIIKRYIKDVFRDITYHLSITQLKILPLPTREEMKELVKTLIVS